MSGPVGVALAGAGVISHEYLRTLRGCPDVRVLGVADVDTGRAGAVAAEHGVPEAGDLEAVLALAPVELVLNLTPPAAHAAVTEACLEAGKHVYVEKPLALEPADGDRLLEEAASRRLRIGGAPDTFLGPAVQAARRAIDEGLIGTPVTVSAAVLSVPPEIWHPRPEFLYGRGAGPLFDVGPYVLTQLVALLGPIATVAALAREGPAERVIGSGPRAGARFAVEVPTHVAALLELARGACASATFSFDSAFRRTRFEIGGTEGALALPDPIFFAGSARIRRAADDDWRDLPRADAEYGRGVGVVEMARALRSGAPHRASGALARHVLDAMAAIAEAAEAGAARAVGSHPPVPEPLPPAWDPRAATSS